MTPTLPPAITIRSYEDLQTLAASLQHAPLIGIDTESNSLYAYRERVCLIQISTRQQDFIVDPLIIEDVRPLGPVLANPAVEKVFHAAEYDLMCLKRDYDFTVNNLFDTMIAARICGHKQVGLGNLLQEFAGVTPDKRHQRDDWGQRPLPADSLAYAQMDTHFLPLLRDSLGEELERLGRWPEAREAFAHATRVTAPDLSFDPEGYWRLGIPNRLTRREMAILRELYLLREQIAERANIPPFKVFGDRTLLQLARIGPSTTNDFYGIEGMSPGQIRRYGKQVLQAIARGEQARPPEPPPTQRPANPDVVECYTALREWRKARAQQRGVESDVIVPREALWALAERRPDSMDAMRDIPGLGPWRLEQYGPEILDALRGCKPRRDG